MRQLRSGRQPVTPNVPTHPPTHSQVAALPASALATLESLREAACKAAQAPSAGQEASERCESAAAWLEAALQAEEARLPADLEKLYATKLEPAAQEAAAALEAVWEAPEISNERLLQLAQGAATRGCAYLRCACLPWGAWDRCVCAVLRTAVAWWSQANWSHATALSHSRLPTPPSAVQLPQRGRWRRRRRGPAAGQLALLCVPRLLVRFLWEG